MSKGSDGVLHFQGDEGQEMVLVHATILKLHSPALAQALESAPSSSSSVKCSSSNSSPAAKPKVQMLGTSKADFLVVAQFMYPIMPLPKVSWDNLEVLLVVLCHAAEFLQANASSLDLNNNSPKYAFKWLQLADEANLADAWKACINNIIELGRSSLRASHGRR
ncbi:hypothetical protein COO60DRAFT_1640467 [Scenedesmus sp. NREL 46B-D3]|nr:hypothetical protein COO60DRAFT_1640467 [Scenedesmus sp. NREL 46B-D3]